MLVSIIIPVYNVERYIKRCFQSVSAQTYKNLEIIIVDDGSTDSSGNLCDEFANSDKRALVIHKENGGLSSARNVGKSIAKGEYLTFLDSDDFLAKDFIEKALLLCKENSADISILNMAFIEESSNEEICWKDNEVTLILQPEEAIKESLYQKNFSCCAPGKLYKKTTLDGIEFPLNKLSEDLAVCHLIFNKAKSIIFSNQIGYYYRQQQNSIMHVFNSRRLDALLWTREIEAFCTLFYPSILHAAKCRSFNVAIHLALDLPSSKAENQTDYCLIWKEVKRTRMSVITDSQCRFREKAAAFLSLFGLAVLKIVWNSRFAVKNKNSK